MTKEINIKDRKKALSQLSVFKQKKYYGVDIKFNNVNLRAINELIRQNVFRKNDVYINSITLWELMQPVGKKGSHNYHGLSPSCILEVLNTLNNPIAMFESKDKKYAIITPTKSPNKVMMTIIEVGQDILRINITNINKVVTIYPKSNIEKIMNNIEEEKILLPNKK